MNEITKIVIIGIGATIAVDLWSAFLRLFSITSLDYRYVGRWIAYFPKGVFVHQNIMTTSSVPGELVIGWTAHYLIGTFFAFLLIVCYGIEWIETPALYPALFIGAVSVCAPLFMMQPAFGFGIASAKLPDPNLRRMKSVLTHLIYGIGLYGTALLIGLF